MTSDLTESHARVGQGAWLPESPLTERLRPSFGTGTRTVLLVEDNQGDVRLVREVLAGFTDGIQMSVVGDGLSAVQALRSSARKPDLILLDLNLPRMDGRSFLGWIKAEPDLRRIPVIVLTSSDAPRDVLEAYELNANCYLVKPVLLEDFEHVLRSALAFWMGVARLPYNAT
jgi:CheY-like chemotaxis protein